MQARKVLVKEGDVVTIVCPSCRKTRKLSVAKYKARKKRDLLIRCGCGAAFSLCLEYRRHPRKPVKLLGKSINLSNHRESRDIIINNISQGGIGYCPFKKGRIREDDLLQIFFELDDTRQTLIDARATVRNAGLEYVGCEFVGTESFKMPLGFYLLS